MSPLHNQVSLIGRAGHEVSLIHLSDGTPMARLRLYQRSSSPSEHFASQAYALVAWRAAAIQLHRQVRRGDRLLIQGRLVARSVAVGDRRETRYEVHLQQFELLGRAARTEEPAAVLNEPTSSSATPANR